MFRIGIFLAAAALASAQTLPDGPGKEVVTRVCNGCHKADVLIGRLDTPKNWARKVDSMVDRGAEATPEQIAAINAYLNAHFAFAPDRVSLPDGPGKAALQKVCGTCHPAEIVVTRDQRSGTRGEWAKTINRMLARGAKGTNEEFEEITNYLSANFGYIPVPSYLPDGPGKKTVERVCGPCHGVSLLKGRHNSAEEWNRTVTNMITRGAPATPAEADEITEYLSRYLGPQAGDK